jgi:hypothetical protein
MVADAATDTGKRMGLFEQFQCLAVFAVIDQGDEPLHTDMCGTGCLAGGGSPFADGIRARYGLGILFVGGFSGIEGFVVFVWK